MKKIKCNAYCKSAILIAIVAGLLSITGCAGNITVKNVDGSEVKTPASVGIIASSSKSHETCPDPIAYVPVPMGDPCVANDTPCNNRQAIIGVSNAFAKMEYQEEQNQNLDKSCHAQVASETKAYFDAEKTKYKQVGNFGQTLVRWVSGVFIVDTVTENNSQPAGDTNVDTLNVNGSNVAGAGAEGAGGATGGLTQNINVGSGSISNAQDGAVVVDGEKPIIGDGNNMDDSGDGSNNNPGFFN